MPIKPNKDSENQGKKPIKSARKVRGENPDNNDSRLKALVKASVFAIIADIFLIALKYILSRFTGSEVILADSIHSMGDLGISLMVLLSIVINSRFSKNVIAKQAERIAALIISFALIWASYRVIFKFIFQSSGERIIQTGFPLIVALVGIVITIIVTFLMSNYKRNIGKKHDSVAFEAEGIHTFADFLTSLGAWVTIFLLYFGLNIEKFTSFIIGLAVLRIGIMLFIRSFGLFVSILKLIYQGISFVWIRITPQKFRAWLKKQFVLIGAELKPYLAPLKLSVFFAAIGKWIAKQYTSAVNFLSKLAIFNENWLKLHFPRLIWVVLCIILVLYLGTGLYTLEPHQSGIELLLGRVIAVRQPGLHIHFPEPFGGVLKINTGMEHRLEVGFRTSLDTNVEEPEAYLWESTHISGRYQKITTEAITLTGDENLLDGNFLCYYMIKDPIKFALNTAQPEEIIRSLLCHHSHKLLGMYHLDSILTSSRLDIQEQLTQKMKAAVSALPLGVEITRVYMRETHPPIYVVPKYRAVSSAREEKDEIIHIASGYANDHIPRAKGEASSLLLEARAYALEESLKAHSNTLSFKLRQQNFSKYQNATQIRLRWEKLETLLADRELIILPSEARKRVFPSNQGRYIYE
ncbi:protease modulator HflK family protein [bacterium]|nr:protease modulator HflK family protein [bacterium]